MERERLDYLNSLIEYLQKDNDENYKKLEEASKHTNGIRAPLYPGEITLAQNLEDIQKLKNGDKTGWARLLWYLPEYMSEYKQLKELSPFKNNVIIQIHNGNGEYHHIENMEMKVWEKLRSDDFANGVDDYLFVMPFSEDILEKSEVVWVRGDYWHDYPKNFKREKKGGKNEDTAISGQGCR